MAGKNVEGVDDMLEKINRLSKQVSNAGFGRALYQGGLVIERAVKQNIRGQGLIDTGNYRASVRTVQLSQVRVMVFSSVVYGPIQEYGGTITAKRAPFLVFQVGGQWVRVKSVTIPGRPHWRPAVDSNKRKIYISVADTMSAEIRNAI